MAANTAFWINNALGLLIAGTLVTTSGLIADRIFHDPRVAPVLQVMALQVLLSASVSVHTSLLQKDLNFRHLFWVRLATVTTPGLASIPLAWYGMGYWALVAGSLTGQVFQVVLLWRTCHWRPGLTFNREAARKLAGFGGWVAATGLITWVYAWGDSLVVSIFLGSESLGLYRVGQQVILLVFGTVLGSALPVVYSHLCAIQNGYNTQTKVYLESIKIIKKYALVSALFGLITLVCAPYIHVILGEQWSAIENVVSILTIGAIFSWVIAPVNEFYRAITKPHYETVVLLVTLPVFIMGFLISIQHSFEAFLWTRVGLIVFVGVPVKYYLFHFVGRRLKLVAN